MDTRILKIEDEASLEDSLTAQWGETLPKDVIDFAKAPKTPTVRQTNTNEGNIVTEYPFSTTVYSLYYSAVLTGFKVSSYSYGTKCSGSI